MAATTWGVYGPAGLDLLGGPTDIDNDSFRMVLLTDAYSPNQAEHGAWSSLSAAEVAAGAGYALNGLPVTLSLSRTGLLVDITADANKVWTAPSGETLSAKYAAIVRDASGDGALDAGDLPFAYADLNNGGGMVSATGGSFTVSVAAGIGRLTLAAAA